MKINIMSLKISDDEKKLLISLKKGVSKIKFYKFSDYVSVVTFVLLDRSLITIRSRDEYIAPMFEVFPISVTNMKINGEADKVIEFPQNTVINDVILLSKYEWSVPTSVEDKVLLLGESNKSTTQYEGLASDIPDNAIHKTKLHSGIQIKYGHGESFSMSSSINPFDLAVSDDISFEKFIPDIYEYVSLC
jgi:hypothetical protein